MPNSINVIKGTGAQSSMPALDRRNTCSSSPSHKANLLLGKSPATAVPSKGRSGGSPQQLTTSLASSNSRGSGGPSPVPPSTSVEQVQTNRRQTHPESTEKRMDVTHSSHSSPGRKNVDLEASVTRRNSSSRPSVSAVANLLSATNLSIDAHPQETQLRRRGSITVSPSISPKPNSGLRPADRAMGSAASRTQPRRAGSDISSASSSSSGGSSDGLGSVTDSTVTSDGGFTDYLSDESEAELQRQAEARAALLAQNQAEEQEFKAARQQLAHVDLRPPKSWNAATLPRSTGSAAHVPSYSSVITYSNVPFTPTMAHTVSSSRG
jgi:hypothetical protein